MPAPHPAFFLQGSPSIAPSPAPPRLLLLAPVTVVLVSPKTAGNVGAAARCCGNFEAGQLVVVDPRCEPHGEEARTLACGAAAMESMRVVPSLGVALADSTSEEGVGGGASLLLQG
jgi:hypothetical protein